MASDTTGKIVENSNRIIALTDNLETFLSADNSRSSQYTGHLKNLYDISKSFSQDSPSSATLKELTVTDFDDEQIWQQLELENESCISNLLNGAAKLISSKIKCSFKPVKQDSSKTQSNQSKDKNVLENEVRDKVSRLRKSSEENYKKELDEEENFDADFSDDDDDDDDDDDNDIADIEEKLDVIDKNDKFFDFTGDSDEDLNFDFGPLGQKGDLDEELFKDDQEEEEENKKIKSKKKSVTFQDEIGQESTKNNKKDNKKQIKKNSKKGSIVDDAFFKLSELEEFLNKEDKREERRLRKEKNEGDDEEEEEEIEDIDMFQDTESEDEDAHYEDFFDPPDGEIKEAAVQKKSQSNEEMMENEEEDWISGDDEDEQENSIDDEREDINVQHGQNLFLDSDSEGEDITDIIGGKKEIKSSYEIRQDRLKRKISEIEEDMLSEKPWQLAGEVSAVKRPENSLLQENLQFEHTTRLPPEITEHTTQTLEALIKQRIKDQAWNDVKRKVKPIENPFEYKKRVTLDQEKSALSLSQIYEREYQRQQAKEEKEKSDPDHDKIKGQMQSLFIKLDALSNFHFTPKQASAEVKVVTNLPTIQMEEVAPVSVSDGQLLAPEEIKKKERKEVKGTSEKTKSDKLKERMQKKKNQKLKQKKRDKKRKLFNKLNPGLGNKYSKEKAMKKLEKDSKYDRSKVTLLKDKKEKTGLTSSKSFFTKLQEEVTAGINRKQASQNRSAKRKKNSDKKFKL